MLTDYYLEQQVGPKYQTLNGLKVNTTHNELIQFLIILFTYSLFTCQK